MSGELFHRCDIFFDIGDTVSSVCCAELDNGASDDGAIGKICHFFCLLRSGDTEAYGTGDLFGSFYKRYHGSDIGSDGAPHTRHTEGRYAVDEAGGVFCDPGDAVLGGGGNERNEIQTIGFCHGIKFLLFLIRNIRKDQSIHTDFTGGFHKPFRTIGENHIGVCHENQRNVGFLSDSPDHIEDLIRGDAAGECPDIGFLDDRTLRCGIGKRNAQFDQIRSCFFHGVNELFCDLQ